jgi:hypothetical protein
MVAMVLSPLDLGTAPIAASDGDLQEAGDRRRTRNELKRSGGSRPGGFVASRGMGKKAARTPLRQSRSRRQLSCGQIKPRGGRGGRVLTGRRELSSVRTEQQSRTGLRHRRRVLLLTSRYDDQRVIRQWPLQRQRLGCRCRHPGGALLGRGQDHRHGFGMHRSHLGIRLRGQETEQMGRDLTLFQLPHAGPPRHLHPGEARQRHDTEHGSVRGAA